MRLESDGLGMSMGAILRGRWVIFARGEEVGRAGGREDQGFDLR